MSETMFEIDDDADLGAEYTVPMQRGLAAMECPPDTEVLVTDNFVEDVRRITGNAAYGVDRGTSTVAAKTIPLPDRSSLIVINGRTAAEAMPAEDFERLLAHEAGHALLYKRGELFVDERSTDDGERYLKILAAGALEEYRIELSLYEKGYGLGAGVSLPDVERLAVELNFSVCEAIGEYLAGDPASDPVALGLATARVLDWSTKKLAYFAAAVNAGALTIDAAALAEDPRADWEGYVEPNWSHRLAGLAKVPGVLEPVDAAQLSKAVDRLAVVERHYMKSMGLSFKKIGAEWGAMYHHDQRKIGPRVARALAEGQRRELADLQE